MALRCYETLFEQGNVDLAEKLICINMRLGNNLSANGILDYCKLYEIPISHEKNAERLGLEYDVCDSNEKNLLSHILSKYFTGCDRNYLLSFPFMKNFDLNKQDKNGKTPLEYVDPTIRNDIKKLLGAS